MKISTRGRYATRAMLDLALHSEQGYILIKDISRRQDISQRYLEHLLLSLKFAGLVRGKRGMKGGFVLARSPSEIKLLEIIQVMEGTTAPVDCVDHDEICSRSNSCITRDVWVDLKRNIDSFLESITLQDLCER